MELYQPYTRVSTKRQGDIGHGLAAQMATITEYVTRKNGSLLPEVVEVESGKNNDRPMLKQAIDSCHLTGAILIVARLDRLSRSVSFMDNLQKSSVKFVICDFPEANSFTISIISAVAQYELELNHARTKVGLQAAKAKGVILGKTADANRDEAAFSKGRSSGRAVISDKANAFALKIKPVIEAYQSDGAVNFSQIAARLNTANILTYRRKRNSWSAQSVKNVMKRFN